MNTQTIPALGSDEQLHTVTDEKFAKAMWAKLPQLREEFQSFSQFWGYCQGLQRGASRLGGTVIRDERRSQSALTRRH